MIRLLLGFVLGYFGPDAWRWWKQSAHEAMMREREDQT